MCYNRGNKENAMKTLLTLDQKDYTPDLQVREKYSTRAIIVKDGRIATQHGGAGEYKILGGGVESGEAFCDALCREVQEESGLIVIPETIREIGEIVERRLDIFNKEEIYVCHSLFYFCDVKSERTEAAMTESEIAKGYHLTWATAEEIISGNTPFFDSQPWIFRDTEMIRLLQKEGSL